MISWWVLNSKIGIKKKTVVREVICYVTRELYRCSWCYSVHQWTFQNMSGGSFRFCGVSSRIFNVWEINLIPFQSEENLNCRFEEKKMKFLNKGGNGVEKANQLFSRIKEVCLFFLYLLWLNLNFSYSLIIENF